MFVSANLAGGLGNQMFQVANAVSVGKRFGVPYIFKNKAFTPMQAKQPTEYVSNVFCNVPFVEELPCEALSIDERLRAHFPVEFLEESLSRMPVVFDGYFQSVEYFSNITEEIKDFFTPPKDQLDNIINIFSEIGGVNSVSIHIRRGDYLTISSILPTIDFSYFEKALDKIQNVGKILIFSDDKNFAKSLNLPNSTVVEGLQDHEELILMSLCQNNIISNSSFSWWGSFLNRNESRKVFAPSEWLGPAAEHSHKTIYRDDMTLIPVQYLDGVFYAL